MKNKTIQKLVILLVVSVFGVGSLAYAEPGKYKFHEPKPLKNIKTIYNITNTTSTTTTVVGAGTDMWTGLMGKSELFTPHQNTCDPATESFVEIMVGIGYCIEIYQHPAEEWEYARDTCLQEGKRLPEVAEFQFACEQSALLGLNNMTDDLEWSSNFYTATGSEKTSPLMVPVAGLGGCNTGIYSAIATQGGTPPLSRTFHCVR